MAGAVSAVAGEVMVGAAAVAGVAVVDAVAGVRTGVRVVAEGVLAVLVEARAFLPFLRHALTPASSPSSTVLRLRRLTSRRCWPAVAVGWGGGCLSISSGEGGGWVSGGDVSPVHTCSTGDAFLFRSSARL